MKKILLFFITIAFFAACASQSAADKTYSEETMTADIEAAVKEMALDEAQMEKINRYVQMANEEGKMDEMLVGKTYKDIIEVAMAMEDPPEEVPIFEEAPADTTQGAGDDDSQAATEEQPTE